MGSEARDLDRIKRETDIVSVIRSYGIDLKDQGANEFTACCPFHNETTPSFRVYTVTGYGGKPPHYHCFGCGAHGDVFDFITEISGASLNEAISQIEEINGGSRPVLSNPVKQKPRIKGTPVEVLFEPVAAPPAGKESLIDELGAPGRGGLKPSHPIIRVKEWGSWKEGPHEIMRVYYPILTHPFKDPQGRVLAYTIRAEIFDAAKGRNTKMVLPVSWGIIHNEAREALGKSEGWILRRGPGHRYPYGVESLTERPGDTVVVVEGEKSRDATAAMIDALDYVTISWCGGTNNCHNTDWSLLQDRHVILCPDNDPQGIKAMRNLAMILDAAGVIPASIRMTEPPSEFPDGWDTADLADVDWGLEDLLGYLDASVPFYRDDQEWEEFKARFANRPNITRDAMQGGGPDKPSGDESPWGSIALPDFEGDEGSDDHGSEGRTAGVGEENSETHQPHSLPVEPVAPRERLLGQWANDISWYDFEDATHRLKEDVSVMAEDLYLTNCRRLHSLHKRHWVMFEADMKRLKLPISGIRKAMMEEVRNRHKDDDLDQAEVLDPIILEAQELHETRIIPLGFNGDKYYFLSKTTEQIVTITSSSFSNHANFYRLAPRAFWGDAFAGDKGPDFSVAASYLMELCHRAGIFDSKKIRGRGAWHDDSHILVHLGNRILVNGDPIDINAYDSKYIYERAQTIPAPNLTNPLSVEEARKLLDICRLMRWKNPTSGELLAGWIVSATICGALRWRSHIWLTGGAGSGKTWIMQSVVTPLLKAASAVLVQSTSTEAGMRQTLKTDALPVVFDEAESEDLAAKRRIGQILELMRSSSAESDFTITKGSSGGDSFDYRIRSSFCLSSIAVGISKQSDYSRIAILSLDKPPKKGSPFEKADNDRFVEMQEVARHFTPDYARRLWGRTISLMPVIQANTEIFGRAVRDALGTQRNGDQYGTLLAGTYSLMSDDVVSEEEARAFVESLNWTDASDQSDISDDLLLLNLILQHRVSINSDNGGHYNVTLAQLILAASDEAQTSEIPLPPKSVAKNELGINGIRVQGDLVFFANSSESLRRIVRENPRFENNYSEILGRVDGATKANDGKVIHFATGLKSRGIAIPLARLVGGEDANLEG